MAATALEVVPREEIKLELRILARDTDHDTILESQISAACSFVSRQVETPLVDVTETIYVPRPATHEPLTFRALAVKQVEEVGYWTSTGTLRSDPDGEVDVATLGRHVVHDRINVLYPPSDGWPEVLEGSLLMLTVIRGLDLLRAKANDPNMTEVKPEYMALKQAVILCVRQFYEGYREIRPTEAFYALIAPWRRYD